MINNLRIEGSLMPTDVKIYTEDGTPYLDYTGTCYMSDGCKYKIHFPKIGFAFSQIMQEKEDKYDYFGYKRKILMNFNIFASDNKFYEFEIIEREVSKKQLEKELGYKLNIKEWLYDF